jgi:hypothetical protein
MALVQLIYGDTRHNTAVCRKSLRAALATAILLACKKGKVGVAWDERFDNLIGLL